MTIIKWGHRLWYINEFSIDYSSPFMSASRMGRLMNEWASRVETLTDDQSVLLPFSLAKPYGKAFLAWQRKDEVTLELLDLDCSRFAENTMDWFTFLLEATPVPDSQREFGHYDRKDLIWGLNRFKGRIVKMLEDLTEQDLLTHPLWAWDMADEDEADITPVQSEKDQGDPKRSLAIRTEFLCNNGRRLTGYLTPFDTTEIRFLQPTLVVGLQQYPFYYGICRPEKDNILSIAEVVGENGFPIQYRTSESLFVQTVAGKLDGLYYRDDDSNEIKCLPIGS